MLKKILYLSTTLLITTSCSPMISNNITPRNLPYLLGEQLFCDDLSNDLSNWLAEGTQPKLANSKMELDTAIGTTIWFKPRLSGNIMIEYDVTVVDNNGPNDRVSDLNCFWMATDPNNPENLFASSGHRAGIFKNYDSLNLYYVGYGGNSNTTTRFRKYHAGNRQLLAEYTDLAHLIVPNHTYHIQLIRFDNTIEYYRNGKRLFKLEDPKPYSQGHFGFRTVKNHLVMDNFRVVRIIEKKSR